MQSGYGRKEIETSDREAFWNVTSSKTEEAIQG
jgi:hypothetical protein